MNFYSKSGPSSTAASISDLDGYSFPANSFIPVDNDDFGFDPPEQKTRYPKMMQTYSPTDDSAISPPEDWPGF